MSELSNILNYSFIFFSMLGIGLKITREDISNSFSNKPLIIRALLANFVIVPLIAFILLKIIPLSQTDTAALMLLAITPGGLSALQFTTKAKKSGSLAYAATLSFMLSILSMIISPLLILVFRQRDFELNIPYGNFIFVTLILVLLPLLAGIFTGEKKNSIAQKISKPVSLIGTLCFFGIIISTLQMSKEAKSVIDSKTILVILIFIGLCILTGWIMGGPDAEKRRLLAAITSMRNFALCLLIVTQSIPGMGLEYPVTAFASFMVPPNFLMLLSYTLYMKHKEKKNKAIENKTDTV